MPIRAFVLAASVAGALLAAACAAPESGKPAIEKSPMLSPTDLSEPEIARIVAFLESLTSTEPCTAPALP